jgi:hypothetical protein
MEPPVQTPNDLRQSRIVMKQDSTLIAVIEMSLSSWLVAGIAPGAERQPLKKLAVDANALVKLLNRWREEAEKAKLNALQLPSRPGGTVSGWHAGSRACHPLSRRFATLAAASCVRTSGSGVPAELPESDGHQGRDEPDVPWWRLTGARSPSSELRPANQEC